MIPLSTPALVIALLAAQDSGRRVPILATDEAQTYEAKSLAPDTALRLYDVGHLTGHTRLRDLLAGFADTANRIEIEGAIARLERLERLRTEVRSTTDSLVATIREMISPPLQEDIQRVDHLDRGSLALVGTRVQHEWLAQFLEAASGFNGLIDVQASIYVLEEGGLAELSQVRSGEVLSPAQVTALVGELELADVTAVTSPRVTTFPFQEAQLSIIEQVAYIKDYELKILPEQSVEIADPVIDVVNTGVIMQVRGVPLANHKLGIFASLEYSVLERPIRTIEMTLGAMGHQVTIQLPHVTRVMLEGRFEVLPDETLLLATVDPAGGNEVLALLRVTRVENVQVELSEDR
ncbi:MAG: hypothetical protein E2O39_12850 [Planctomycetota bacterium]|nr:MAG: hypothetical protein E2O39_12850 [Planctomycetota bacterium]